MTNKLIVSGKGLILKTADHAEINAEYIKQIKLMKEHGKADQTVTWYDSKGDVYLEYVKR